MIFIFSPTFSWLKGRFTEADTYYSHGFLVPLVSLFLIYRKKEELLKTPQKNTLSGIFIIFLGLMIHLIALRWGINFVSAFSLIIVLFGLFLALWGREVTGKNMFALLFLIFMVPLPKVLIIAISFKLKILVASFSANIINAAGIPALRMGSVIQLPNTTVTVGDPCSGLRSLISLLALGVLYAYMSNLSRGKKIILFLSTIPIAVIANIIRIVLLLFVAYVYGREFATGKFHDFSGFVVFIIALMFLMFIGRVLSWQKKS
ncbi:MAG: exosortase/archaeosortase family protein [Candidatus Omnitrophota bacterium]